MDEIDTLLTDAIAKDGGAVRVSMVINDLTKIAPIYADEETRPVALAILKQWEEGADALRKGLASAWLSSAKAMYNRLPARLPGGAMSTVGALRANPQAVSSAFSASAKAGRDKVAGAVSGAVSGIKSAATSVGNAINAGESKAGDLGARAGESYGRSALTASARNTASVEGGMAARGRLADRMKPNPAFDMSRGTKFTSQPNNGPKFGFLDDPGFRPQPASESFRPQMGAPISGRSGRMEAPQANPMQEKALNDAYAMGSKNSGNAFAGAHARQGRVIARHAFRAGLATAGAGAAAGAVAGGMSLSQKQHEERVNAGKHSHQGSGMMKADPCWDGYKQIGMKKKGKRQVPNCVPASSKTK